MSLCILSTDSLISQYAPHFMQPCMPSCKTSFHWFMIKDVSSLKESVFSREVFERINPRENIEVLEAINWEFFSMHILMLSNLSTLYGSLMLKICNEFICTLGFFFKRMQDDLAVKTNSVHKLARKTMDWVARQAIHMNNVRFAMNLYKEKCVEHMIELCFILRQHTETLEDVLCEQCVLV